MLDITVISKSKAALSKEEDRDQSVAHHSSSSPGTKWLQVRHCWNEGKLQAEDRDLQSCCRETIRLAEDMLAQQIGIRWMKLLGYSQVTLLEPSHKYWHCKYSKPANLPLFLLSLYKHGKFNFSFWKILNINRKTCISRFYI